jgi:hypothetical protein
MTRIFLPLILFRNGVKSGGLVPANNCALPHGRASAFVPLAALQTRNWKLETNYQSPSPQLKTKKLKT